MKKKLESLSTVVVPRLVRCSSFNDVDQQLEALRVDLMRLWGLVVVLLVACLLLAVDSCVQGALIRRSSNQPHPAAKTRMQLETSQCQSKTESSSIPFDPEPSQTGRERLVELSLWPVARLPHPLPLLDTNDQAQAESLHLDCHYDAGDKPALSARSVLYACVASVNSSTNSIY